MAEKEQQDLLRNKLYHMDCLELLSQIPDGHVSMILTDPPYGINYQNCYTSVSYTHLTLPTTTRV